MESDEADIPIINDVQQALNHNGPFSFYPWCYDKIKLQDIPKDKWHLFHDMLLREKSILWSIRNNKDVDFISNVIREHKDPASASLDFYTNLDKENLDKLATAIRASRIRKIFLRKDAGVDINLSSILQALQHLQTLEELKIPFEPATLDECQALADALQNNQLKSYFALKEVATAEYWTLITPILSSHPSMRELTLCVSNGQCHYVNKILSENKILEKLSLSLEDDTTAEDMELVLSGLKVNTTLKSLYLSLETDQAPKLLFNALAHNQIKISNLDVSCEMQKDEVTILGNALKTNTCLTNLALPQIFSCTPLAEGLKHNSTLKSLRIICVKEDIEGLKALCDALKTTNSLTALNLRI